MLKLDFVFTETCWLWQSEKAAWHFVTVPKKHSEEISFFTENNLGKRRGWGAVRVNVRIGNSEWQTSIFPSKSHDAYILPIKQAVRKQEQIATGDVVQVALTLTV